MCTSNATSAGELLGSRRRLTPRGKELYERAGLARGKQLVEVLIVIQCGHFGRGARKQHEEKGDDHAHGADVRVSDRSLARRGVYTPSYPETYSVVKSTVRLAIYVLYIYIYGIR